MNANAFLSEQAKLVVGLPPITPASSTPDYVSLKGYSKCTVVILGLNGAGVTGSAITLKQAQAVAGTGEKALAFDTVHSNIDAGAADALADVAVTNNTFTTDVTNAKQLMYVIDIDEADLDVANGFDCVRAGAANAVNATLSILYILWPAKYGKATPPSAIID
jgi:hypothetical protein